MSFMCAVIIGFYRRGVTPQDYVYKRTVTVY
jgi:hypothetical protein